MRSLACALTLLLAACLALGGCNTVAGFGKDLEKAGEKIKGAASDKKSSN